jgi:hypothetical protein
MAWRITGPSSSRAQLPASYFIGEWRDGYSPDPMQSKENAKRDAISRYGKGGLKSQNRKGGHAISLEGISCELFIRYWRGAK